MRGVRVSEGAATSVVATAIVGDEWTIGSLAVHMSELRAADIKYNESVQLASIALETERDRRYAEVNVEKEKALKIKETADLAALTLAREIQSYKDINAEKAREQGLRDTGAYVTRDDLASIMGDLKRELAPFLDYVTKQQGVVVGSGITAAKLYSSVVLGGIILGGAFTIIDHFLK